MREVFRREVCKICRFLNGVIRVGKELGRIIFGVFIVSFFSGYNFFWEVFCFLFLVYGSIFNFKMSI